MKKLLVLVFALVLFAGCAVVTPYGTSLYVPVPEIAVTPYPYSYYPYSWSSWGPGCCSSGYSYRPYHGYYGPYRGYRH